MIIIAIILSLIVVIGNWNNNRSYDKLYTIASKTSLRVSKDQKTYIVRRGIVLCTGKKYAFN